MAVPGPVSASFRVDSEDLWSQALGKLCDSDKQQLKFGSLDEVEVLAELVSLTKTSHDDCVKKRWRFVRQNGEVVIIRDLFAKIIKCLQVFQQIGDNAVQFDPHHAALPWAGIRLLLQMAVNDVEKFAFVIEGCTNLTYLIDYYSIMEKLYLGRQSLASGSMRECIIVAYALILEYLCQAKAYFTSKTLKRIASSVLLGPAHLQELMTKIERYVSAVDRFAREADAEAISQLRQENQRSSTDIMGQNSAIKDLLVDLRSPVTRIDDRLKDLHDNISSENRVKVLQWVSSEPYMQYHIESKREVLPGTGQWLLAEPDFRTWRNSSSSSVLWLRGSPGTGKSKLISMVIEDLQKSFRTGQCPPPAYFYCSKNPAEPKRSQPAEVMSSIARQLSAPDTALPLLDPVLSRYRLETASGFAAGRLSLDDATAMVIELVELYPVAHIVIDALDEMIMSERWDFLDCVEKIMRESLSLVKIFISSRDEADLRYELNKYPNLEISSVKNSEDISSFVHTEVQRLTRRGVILRHSQTKEKMKAWIMEELIRNAGGMFRWVSLQLEYIRTMTLDSQIMQQLGMLPPSLKDLYQDIYSRQCRHEIEALVVRHVFSWLLFSQRLWSSDELVKLVSLAIDVSEQELSEDYILALCSNFVVMAEDTGILKFAHLSVREFLEGLPEFSSTTCNALLATTCLSVVILASDTEPTKAFLRKTCPKLLAKQDICVAPSYHRDYATIYWAHHCDRADFERRHGLLRHLIRMMLLSPPQPDFPFHFWMTELEKNETGAWLNPRLRDAFNRWLMSHFLACAFGFVEVVRAQLRMGMVNPELLNRNGLSALAVATRYKHLELAEVLFNVAPSTLTEQVMLEAAGSPEFIQYFLPMCSSTQLTPKVVLAAASYQDHKLEALSILLSPVQGIKLSEPLLTTMVASRQCDPTTLRQVLHMGGRAFITKNLLVVATTNTEYTPELMEVLLDSGGDKFLSEDLLIIATGIGAKAPALMTVLLDHGGRLYLTEKVLVASAACEYYAVALLRVLFVGRDDLPLTQQLMVTAARNESCGTEVVEFLLDCISSTGCTNLVIQPTEVNSVDETTKDQKVDFLKIAGNENVITEQLLIETLSNHHQGYPILRCLLRHSPHWPLTEDVLIKVAGNRQAFSSLKLLLSRGQNIEVTENILMAAAMNSRDATEGYKVLMAFLHYDEDFECSESLMKAMTQSKLAVEMTNWFLDHGRSIPLTSAVLTAAAGNHFCAVEVLQTLLDLDPNNDVEITEDVLKSAIRNFAPTKVLNFLKHTGKPFQISEEVMRSAVLVIDGRQGANTLEWLRNEGGSFVVSEADLLVAARCIVNTDALLKWLFQYAPEAIVTDAVVAAATSNKNNVDLALNVIIAQKQKVEITKIVAHAIVENTWSGAKALRLLLAAGCEMTEEGLTILASCAQPIVVDTLRKRLDAQANS